MFATLGTALRTRWPGFLLAAVLLVLAPIALALPVTMALAKIPDLPGWLALGGRFVLFVLIVALPGGAVVHLVVAPRGRLLPTIGEALVTTVTRQPVITAIGLVGGAPRLLADFASTAASVASPEWAMRLVFVQLGCWVVTLLLVGATFIAAPAAVCERIGPLAAIARSVRLMAGRRWLSIGLLLAAWAPFVLGGLAFATIMTASALDGRHQLTATGLVFVGGAIALTVARVFTLAFAAACYLEFRRVIDPPLEETAEVFA